MADLAMLLRARHITTSPSTLAIAWMASLEADSRSRLPGLSLNARCRCNDCCRWIADRHDGAMVLEADSANDHFVVKPVTVLTVSPLI